MRRAQLPVALSQGFNPRLRVVVPVPLAVSIAGENEVADFELNEWMKPGDFAGRLAVELPEGIELVSAVEVPGNREVGTWENSYRVRLLADYPVTPQAIEGLLAEERVVVDRRRKSEVKKVDIRPFIGALRLGQNDVLHMLLHFTPNGSARPEEVLRALGCLPGQHYLPGSVVRTSVNLSSSL